MTPTLLIFIIQEAISLAPGLYTEIAGIFASPTPPTAADWQALLAKISAKSYADYDPGLATAPGAPAAAAVAASPANVVQLVTAAPQASTAAPAPLVATTAAPDQPTAAPGAAAAAIPAPPTIPTDDAGLAALVNAVPAGELAALYQAGDKLRSLVNARWAAPPAQVKS